MSISTIEIVNFKSIDYLKLNIQNLTTAIGKNGSGKTSIMNAIKFYYDNLTESIVNSNNYDSENNFKLNLKISITYNLAEAISKLNECDLKKRLISLSDKNGILCVTLDMLKTGEKKWSINYKDRVLIKNIYPIYFVFTRDIQTTSWENVWEIVGDLINITKISKAEKSYDKLFDDQTAKEYIKSIDLIDHAFKHQNISTSNNTKKEQVMQLIKLYFGGHNLIIDGKEMDFYSAGINSKEFFMFLFSVINKIGEKRPKSPLIIIDEPEIGLHPLFIDEIIYSMIDNSKHTQYLIFSHSPRLTAAMLQNGSNLYRVFMDNNYTNIKKIINVYEPRKNIVITEVEAACLFYDKILFVEGDTEIEIFKNKYLTNLFPDLKNISMVNTKSNNVILKVLTPNMNKASFKYKILLDSDKIINFDQSKLEPDKVIFTYKAYDYSPFFRNPKKQDILNLTHLKYDYRKYKILQSISKYESYNNLSFSYDLTEGKLIGFRNKFIDIKKCLENFNVLITRTTIEGCIVDNNKEFLNWIEYEKRKSVISSFLKGRKITKNSENYIGIKYYKKIEERMKPIKNLIAEIKLFSTRKRDTACRLLVNGKVEWLINNDKNTFLNAVFSDKQKREFEKSMLNKTEWVTDFFYWYFEEKYGELANKEKINKFINDFPHLYDIIMLILSNS